MVAFPAECVYVCVFVCVCVTGISQSNYFKGVCVCHGLVIGIGLFI